EQKRKFLPATANLDIWWSQGFSEPEAGSDLAGLKTTARRDGDTYIVNGQKTWTTLGQYGDWMFLLARTDPAARKQQGISFLLLDLTTPGVEHRPIRLIDGGYEVNEFFFDDVRIPAENLVGEENKGWTYAKFLLGNERNSIAQTGTAQRLFADLVRYADTRHIGVASLADDPDFRSRL
ncbi:acyl-CoA dehydrogenase family protein, partial [Nocardia gipuzkoensis]